MLGPHASARGRLSERHWGSGPATPPLHLARRRDGASPGPYGARASRIAAPTAYMYVGRAYVRSSLDTSPTHTASGGGRGRSEPRLASVRAYGGAGLVDARPSVEQSLDGRCG